MLPTCGAVVGSGQGGQGCAGLQEGTLAALLERRAISANLSAEPAVRFVQSEDLFEDPFRNAESRASEDMLRAIVAATDHNYPSRPQVRCSG